MSISIDWTALGVIVSLITSIVTLYLAHLRGPDIDLANPSSVYPCDRFSISRPSRDPKETLPLSRGYTIHLESSLLIVNLGNRPGVLFDFRVDGGDSAIKRIRLSPEPERGLPISLSPGEGWKTRISIDVQPDSGSWKDMERYAARRGVALIRTAFLTSSTFPWRRRKRVQVKIDLAPIRKELNEGEEEYWRAWGPRRQVPVPPHFKDSNPSHGREERDP